MAYVTVCVCGMVAERWAGKLVFIAGNDAANAQLSDEQRVLNLVAEGTG
jgi:hypothetical protein